LFSSVLNVKSCFDGRKDEKKERRKEIKEGERKESRSLRDS